MKWLRKIVFIVGINFLFFMPVMGRIIEITGEESIILNIDENTQFNDNTDDFASVIWVDNPNAVLDFAGRHVFKNNSDHNSVTGGAIYNRGTIIFDYAVFLNNYADTNKNDIFMYEHGNLMVRQNLTLDGGIINLGYGDIVFKENSVLRVSIPTTKIIGNVRNNGATLDFFFDSDFKDGEYVLITGYLDREFKIAKNPYYEITPTAKRGTYYIRHKNYSEIGNFIGLEKDQLNTATSFFSFEGADSQTKTKDELWMLLIENEEEVVTQDFMDSLPDNQILLPMENMYLSQNANNLFNIIGNQFYLNFPFNYKDLDDRNIWATTSFNKSEYSGRMPFNTTGETFAFGADSKLNKNFKLGTGLAYTSAKFGTEDLTASTWSGLIYNEYRTRNKFINTALSYSRTIFSENDIDFRAHAYAVHLLLGQDVRLKRNNVISPQIGVNYLHTSLNDYIDYSGANINPAGSNVLNLSGGARYAFKQYTHDYNILIGAKIMAKYDAVQEYDNLYMTDIHNSVTQQYALKPEKISGEVGLDIAVQFGNTQIIAGYAGNFRKDYVETNGKLTIKHHF